MNRLEQRAAAMKPNDQLLIARRLKDHFKDRLRDCQIDLERKNAAARDDQRRIDDQARTIIEQTTTKWCLVIVIVFVMGLLIVATESAKKANKEANAAMVAISEEHTKIYKDVSAAMIKARVYILACKASGFQPEGDSNE